MVLNNKESWGTKLLEDLWDYQTTIRGPTKSTPYSLVYGCEAAVPLEVQLPSLRVVVAEKLADTKHVELRLQELDSTKKDSQPGKSSKSIKLAWHGLLMRKYEKGFSRKET